MASRTDTEKYLSGMNFPANKGRIVSHAKSQGAPTSVIDSLNELPDREFGGTSELFDEMGGDK